MNLHKPRTARSIAVLSLLAASAFALTKTPAAATIANAIHGCSTAQACLQWTNAGSGPAVVGIGAHNDGVRGKTSGSSTSGVYGENDASTGGYAMYASSPNSGLGIFAFSASGTGIAATSDSGVGLYSRAGSGGANPAILANQDNTSCSPACVPVIVAEVAGSTHVMSVDTHGNMILSGSLTQNGSPQLLTTTRFGKSVVAYAPRSSQPAIEDFGEANLSNGIAHVALDPTFASTVDGRATYLVFVTPQAETAGTLAVIGKTPTGFTVRETGGRASIPFDYRVVAKPIDESAAKLPPSALERPGRYAIPHGR